MRFLTYICLIILMLSSGQAKTHEADNKPITLFLQEALDKNGVRQNEPSGIIKFVAYFERETGLKFQTVYLPWNRAKLMTLERKGIIWGFSKSPERLNQYHFSETVLRSKIWAIAYGKPKFNMNKIDDLKGKIVSVERGVSHGMEFENARNIVFTVDEDVSSAAVRFKKLIAKRSDVLLWGLVQFEKPEELTAYLHKTYIPNIEDPTLLDKTFYVSSLPLFYDSLHFASAQGYFLAEMDKIDRAIKRGIANGELVKILREVEGRGPL